QRAKDAAEEASRAKGEFVANMSHELRTPITAIVGYADMLHNPRLEADKRDRALRAVRRNGQHLLTVINDILDLSKIEAGRLELEWLAESPWQAVLDVAAGQRMYAEEKGLAFRAVPAGRLPRRLTADPTRLRQILLNFVSNAVKFTERGSVEMR